MQLLAPITLLLLTASTVVVAREQKDCYNQLGAGKKLWYLCFRPEDVANKDLSKLLGMFCKLFYEFIQHHSNIQHEKIGKVRLAEGNQLPLQSSNQRGLVDLSSDPIQPSICHVH
ncbi:hypothetical protein PSHT_01472 [Puccinia striiformis]|uniref:Uncharacterized protein n=1 Tax=Puccinia striiformis TaxID=27350 RepID=A0A2S4WKB0_9BASI|nr:hypothetical protein PSHT_01472 [Puccinia striiformis]